MADAHRRLGNLEELEADYAKLAELGINPAELIEEHAVQLEDAGRFEDAIIQLEQSRQIPGYVDEPLLIRRLGILLVKAGRYDEALSTFEQQERAESVLDESERDAFLPVNRFRALYGLQRWEEAKRQLDLFEASIEPDSYPWASLLHRRAQLLLAPGSPFADAERALELADEGIALTQRRAPMMYDMALEALVVLGRDEDAIARAAEARQEHPADRRYELVSDALRRALDGDRAGAIEALREHDEEMLGHVAGALESRG